MMRELSFGLVLSLLLAWGCAKKGAVDIETVDTVSSDEKGGGGVSFCGQTLPLYTEELVCEDRDVKDLSPLEALAKLVALDISNTGVTDLQPLSGLAHLKTLWLPADRFTDEQIENLSRANPALEISYLVTCESKTP